MACARFSYELIFEVSSCASTCAVTVACKAIGCGCTRQDSAAQNPSNEKATALGTAIFAAVLEHMPA
eukprot:1462866-Amphidinium_carterae.1